MTLKSQDQEYYQIINLDFVKNAIFVDLIVEGTEDEIFFSVPRVPTFCAYANRYRATNLLAIILRFLDGSETLQLR